MLGSTWKVLPHRLESLSVAGDHLDSEHTHVVTLEDASVDDKKILWQRSMSCRLVHDQQTGE